MRNSYNDKLVSKIAECQNLDLAWLEQFRSFLAVAGGIRARGGRKPILFYPGAGLDVVSFIRTGLDEAVFVDPQYFTKVEKGRYSAGQLTKLVTQCLPKSNFQKLSASLARIDFISDGHNRTIWLVKGTRATELVERRALRDRPFVYLAKAVPCSLLFPHPSDTRKCVGYALDVLFPDELVLVLKYYTDVLFHHQTSDGRHLYIFKTIQPFLRSRSKKSALHFWQTNLSPTLRPCRRHVGS